MASSFFKRLKDKYGSDNIKGKKYRSMMKEIIAFNSEKISNAVARLSNANYQDKVKKLSTKKSELVKLPVLSDVLPKRSVHLIKGAEQGNIISDTLRNKLEKDLRETLASYDKKGIPRMEIQRGKTTGKINPKLIKEFQSKITDTFEAYTKRDKKTGVPPNVKNIAVTEIRSTVNTIKANYNREVLKKNPGAVIEKEWLHNRQLSKKPRQSHIAMHGKTVLLDELFRVAREDGGGVDLMDRPHDPKAPAEQVIGCNCDIRYKTVILKEL